jgi:tRNA nucleotidyltransferase (CCA-adding enzyme)
MITVHENKRIPQSVVRLCSQLHEAGGHVWLVGGCVRDLFLQKAPKDWDLEVFKLQEQELERVLKELGHVQHVGKHFGVFKLWLHDVELDIALPRKEKKTGFGHKGFEVVCAPELAPEQAVLRRDFSINAMMFDPLTSTLLDFHGGQEDLAEKKLKHVSEAFAEDPLRPLRAMQFASRLGLTLDKSTAKLCETLKTEADTLPLSRIWQEWLKWSEGDKPSLGLHALKDMAWDALYPELYILQSCEQDDYWHPEGDVWIHTSLVVDEAARLAKERGLNQEQRTILLFAALCHDLGKPATTFTNEEGKLCSPNHSEAGIEPSKHFLQRIGAPKWLQQAVVPLIQEHVTHFSGEPTVRAVRRLAKRLSPMSIQMWEMLTEADACGRAPAPPSRPALAWLKLAETCHVQSQAEKPIVTGKLLITWGIKPSKDMGEWLKKAYAAQLDEAFCDEISAKDWMAKVNQNIR